MYLSGRYRVGRRWVGGRGRWEGGGEVEESGRKKKRIKKMI